ncbi:hypothetical protein ACG33_11920 [Steroidobacter denitrificans]|uniref:AB hydrolase-1 domain-containing protein n=1 Tax=Steroidobacter denitrificans TaxID=465721 RepID=A0A127FDH1_STEDE|nr:alpha/beta hydrolase [Steroidobacter denitrificans]AMN47790.1 hypothetical protein ACG33_11920 [Steroidobacter denitrificans]
MSSVIGAVQAGGDARPLVILVHGLWMSGLELGIIKRRLEAGQLRAVIFSYPTLRGSMREHARSLLRFARAQRAQTLHFIGHSLGGLVILRALESEDLTPGRVVLMGTPSQGSRAAREIARRLPFGRRILGPALYQECIEPADIPPRQWSGHREVGVIAGSMRLGLGRLFAGLEGEHDGTVRVEETRLPGAKDHIVIATSHTGMLLSAEALQQAVHFLRMGTFQR